jgi:hypothetical protein
MEALRFIEAVFAPTDVIEFRLLPSTVSKFSTREGIERTLAELIKLNKAGQHIYVGVNPRKKEGGKSDADVSLARLVWVDVDNFEDIDFTLRTVSDCGLPAPSMVVSSGRGLHLYWLLDDPVEDLAKWTRMQKGIIKRLVDAGFDQVDTVIHNPSRIMRMPGTVNHKNGKPCTILIDNMSVSYDGAEFPEIEDAPMLEFAGLPEGSRRLDEVALSSRTIDFLNGKNIAKGQRNDRLFKAGCELKALGIAYVEAERLLTKAAVKVGLELNEIGNTIKQAYGKERTMRVAMPDDAIERLMQDDVTDHIIEAAIGSTTQAPIAIPIKMPESKQAQAQTQAQAPKQSAIKVDQIRNASKRFYPGGDDGKAKNQIFCKRITEITDDVLRICDGWPKAVGGALFTVERIRDKPSVRYFYKPDDLFSWFQAQAPVYWHSGDGQLAGVRDAQASTVTAVTKTEFFEHLKINVPDRYLAVSELPHHPPMESIYYVPMNLPPSEGKYLDEFVSMFNVESEEDRLLLKAAVCTPGWGGAPGTRPGFLLEASGPGAGKTSAVFAIARVWGGAHLVSDPSMQWSEIMKQMFSGPSANARMLVVDNAKDIVEGQAIEAAITTPSISGWKAYVGTILRPNDLTVMITANGARTSADMAQRVVVIRMGEPKKGIDWQSKMDEFLAAHRFDVIADVIALLSGPSLYQPSQILGDRFSGWQRSILAKIQGADRLSKTIAQRRELVDNDSRQGEEISRLIYDSVREKLGAGRYADLTAYTLWALLVKNGYWENKKRLDVDSKSILDCAKWTMKKLSRWQGLLDQVRNDAGDSKRALTPCENNPERMVKSSILRFDSAVFSRLFRLDDEPITDKNGQEIPF